MTGRIRFNPPKKEERQTPRRRLEVEGILSCLTENARSPEIRVRTRDISADGVYLWSNTVLRIDERVKLQLRLPPSVTREKSSPVVFFGTVVRIERLSDRRFGLGIRLYGASHI